LVCPSAVRCRLVFHRKAMNAFKHAQRQSHIRRKSRFPSETFFHASSFATCRTSGLNPCSRMFANRSASRVVTPRQSCPFSRDIRPPPKPRPHYPSQTFKHPFQPFFPIGQVSVDPTASFGPSLLSLAPVGRMGVVCRIAPHSSRAALGWHSGRERWSCPPCPAVGAFYPRRWGCRANSIGDRKA
jgi:hypothetical protein